ncbi:DUF4397 domain-containing protein, partial [bacterium]|nr:DUF4397 domain-containing protein [bacterium]
LVITGSPDRLRLFDITDNLGPLAEGAARLTLMHVYEPEPLVTYGISQVEQPRLELRYGQASPSVDLTAGSYDITVERVDNNTPDSLTLEAAEGLLLEAGRTYLYLATGRDELTPPIIYSEEIGFTATDPTIIGADRLPPDGDDAPITAQLRLVHAIDGAATIDLLVDETLVAEGIAYGEASAFVTVTQGSHVIIARDAASGTELLARTLDFGPNAVYSVYVHGFARARLYELTQIEDTGLISGGRNATARLVNLSLDQTTQFALGFLPTTWRPRATTLSARGRYCGAPFTLR